MPTTTVYLNCTQCCPGGGTLVCCSRAFGSVLMADVVGCICIPDNSYPLTWTPGGSSAAGCGYSSPGWYSAAMTCGDKRIQFALFAAADGSACVLHMCCEGTDYSVEANVGDPPNTCNPVLDLMFHFAFGGGDFCCGGDFTVEILES